MQKILSALVALVSVAVVASSGNAADVKVGALQITAPWARATPQGASVGGGYLTITNTGTTPDRLTGGSTPVSERLEVHEMTMDNGVMKMRPVTGGLEIKPGQTVELKPGGYHLMFPGLKQHLQQGHTFKATLSFEKAGNVDVTFDIMSMGATAPGGPTMHNMPGMKMN